MLPVWAAVDASVKHDSTAIFAVSFNSKAKQVKLVTHRVFTPSPDQPIDFGAVEEAVFDLHRRYQLRKVLYDPFQLASTMQRLAQRGVRVEEFPQSVPNLTAASQGLYDLIMSQGIVAYADAGLRLAISRAVAVEGSRGWKISKEKASHKIDQVVALAMACHAATQSVVRAIF